MNSENTRGKAIRRVASVLSFLLGCGLFIGGLGELIGLLFESRLPKSIQAALQKLHELSTIRALVGFIGLVSLLIGLQMLRSYRGVALGEQRAIIRLRRASWALIALLLTAQAVLSLTLYPRLSSLSLPGPFEHFWLLSMIGAALGPITITSILLLLLQKDVEKQEP